MEKPRIYSEASSLIWDLGQNLHPNWSRNVLSLFLIYNEEIGLFFSTIVYLVADALHKGIGASRVGEVDCATHSVEILCVYLDSTTGLARLGGIGVECAVCDSEISFMYIGCIAVVEKQTAVKNIGKLAFGQSDVDGSLIVHVVSAAVPWICLWVVCEFALIKCRIVMAIVL